MMDEDRAIDTLNIIIEYGWLISDMEKCTAIDACELAIDRINKCQKIERILKEPCIIPEGCYPMLNKIREVLEDENR